MHLDTLKKKSVNKFTLIYNIFSLRPMVQIFPTRANYFFISWAIHIFNPHQCIFFINTG